MRTPSRQQHGLWSPRCLPGPSPHSPSISSPCLPGSQPLWPPSLLVPRIPARGPHLTCAGSPGPGYHPISILEHHFLLLTPTNVMNRPCSSPCLSPPPPRGPRAPQSHHIPPAPGSRPLTLPSEGSAPVSPRVQYQLKLLPQALCMGCSWAWTTALGRCIPSPSSGPVSVLSSPASSPITL